MADVILLEDERYISYTSRGLSVVSEEDYVVWLNMDKDQSPLGKKVLERRNADVSVDVETGCHYLILRDVGADGAGPSITLRRRKDGSPYCGGKVSDK